LLYVCHLSWLTTNVELYPSKPTEWLRNSTNSS
jgi:hypothetical protein